VCERVRVVLVCIHVQRDHYDVSVPDLFLEVYPQTLSYQHHAHITALEHITARADMYVYMYVYVCVFVCVFVYTYEKETHRALAHFRRVKV